MRTNPALTIVHQGYLDTKNFLHLGLIIGAYRIFGLASIYFAFNVIASGNINTSMAAVNIFSITLPLIVILYDMQLPRIKGRKEYMAFSLIKFFYTCLYWGQMLALGLAYRSGREKTLSEI